MLSAEPKSEADNTYLDLENQDKPSQGTGIDIVIGNHALRGQPTE